MNNSQTQEYLGAIKVALRQKVSSYELLRTLLPQKLEGGLLINFNGLVIGDYIGADTELCSQERVDKTTKATDALYNDVFKPLQALFGSASEMADQKELDAGDDENYVELKTPEEVEAEAEKPKKKKKSKKADVIGEEELPDMDKDSDYGEILSDKNLIKELKKELKTLEKGTKAYKKCKKELKKLKKEEGE